MKKIITYALFVLLACACDTRYDQYQRLLPTDESVPGPMPVTVTGVRSIAGGAVIKVSYPDDNNIRGTIATYERNGVVVTSKVSRYVDSLVVEGFPDTGTHEVEIASFNVNEVKSASETVKITPLEPAIKTVVPTITATFGGVKILIEGNESKSDLAVCLLRDADLSDESKPIKDRKWVEVTTLFTASNNIRLTRRNLAPEEALYAVYIRDHWGNTSDTTSVKLKPEEETRIPVTTFKDANLPDDNCKSANSSNYPFMALFEQVPSGASSIPHFFACDQAPRPCWLTVSFGLTAQLSRVHTLPRIDYNIWTNAHPRDFEFWGWGEEENPTGVENPDNPHGFQTGWKLLGTFTQYKPTGYDEQGYVGETSPEDREYFNAGNDFEFDASIWPDANNSIRYLRIVFVDNFATFKTEATSMAVQIGEITPYGKVITE